MIHETNPEIGQWYRRLDKRERFEVVAVDEDAGIVEAQYFDGDIEEFELTDWFLLPIEAIAEPEDWTGPMDDIEPDDLGYTETELGTSDWDASQRALRMLQSES
ncbi:MAG: hypothetical protein HUJ28_11540 [Chromatiales bacterium]|nr:hypothetical protein [Chromatiales bacterium]